jgi:hypothetical protein
MKNFHFFHFISVRTANVRGYQPPGVLHKCFDAHENSEIFIAISYSFLITIKAHSDLQSKN